MKIILLITEEEKQLIIDTIQHWEHLISLVESLNIKIMPKKLEFLHKYAVSWVGKCCPLCKNFSMKNCLDCPLRILYGTCNSRYLPNYWKNVEFAQTKEKWIEEAKLFKEQIESLLDYCTSYERYKDDYEKFQRVNKTG